MGTIALLGLGVVLWPLVALWVGLKLGPKLRANRKGGTGQQKQQERPGEDR